MIVDLKIILAISFEVAIGIISTVMILTSLYLGYCYSNDAYLASHNICHWFESYLLPFGIKYLFSY